LKFPFQAADLTKPIDKRIYKGTCPTCHDFGAVTNESEILPLLVGFSLGQIQLVDPIRKELSKLYNEEVTYSSANFSFFTAGQTKKNMFSFFRQRLIEKSKVTCIKWIPGSPNYFLVSYSSGHMYIYNQELACTPQPPTYQLFKSGKTERRNVDSQNSRNKTPDIIIFIFQERPDILFTPVRLKAPAIPCTGGKLARVPSMSSPSHPVVTFLLLLAKMDISEYSTMIPWTLLVRVIVEMLIFHT
jgi:hypothetical protein